MMSRFRFLGLRTITSRFAARRKRPAGRHGASLKPRRLLVDPLERRQLLSVTPAHYQDVLVNQVVNENLQGTFANAFDFQQYSTSESVAADNDGDFVVTWTRYDPVLDAGGNPVLDPQTGEPMTEANIYARYFTDEVQRLMFPNEVLSDSIDQYARFSVVAGGTEVQKIWISATYEPSASFQTPISGTFTLQFDVNQNGVIDGAAEEVTIAYDEMAPLADNVEAIEVGLQGLGGALADVTVRGINPHEYLVEFGDASRDAGGVPLDQPEILVDKLTLNLTGFLPAVLVDTVREPTEITGIPITPDDPYLTATAIEEAFLNNPAHPWQQFALAPIDFPPPERVNEALLGTDLPYYEPLLIRGPVPDIRVTPVFDVPGQENGTVFDVTFVGAFGKQDQPELVATHVQDEFGNPLPLFDVQTLKEPSPEFRVNPEEPDDPLTPGPDKFDQTNAVVAMDADGEFVIAWHSEVPDTTVAGSVRDVFARRFRPVGLVDPADVTYVVDSDLDGVPETPIQGVRGLVSPHARVKQVITFDATADPLVGPFRLRIGDYGTDDIHFDSTDLDAVVRAIQQELSDGGFTDVIVTVRKNTDPYRFLVEYDASIGGDRVPQDVIGDVRLEYVPDVNNPLAAAVTIEDKTTDLLTFRVNQTTRGTQEQPSVGMDDLGNFVIAWTGAGQDISFFNSVFAQRFDRDGQRLGSEFMVNAEDTSIHFNPFVAVSNDGHFIVTWSETDDPNFLIGDPFTVSVNAQVYDPTGAVIRPQFGVGGGGGSSAAWDSENNYIVTWDALGIDPDNTGVNSTGVRSIMYAFDGSVLRDEFRPNSASFDPADPTLWPGRQSNAHPGLDADGDLVIAYDGFGPDVSEEVNAFAGNDFGIDGAFFLADLSKPQNADLLTFFPLGSALASGFFPGGNGSDLDDVDGAIESVLLDAQRAGATDEQLGRLRAILDKAATLVRGEANGVMFSRFDAAPGIGPDNILFSDSVANARRDGRNTRFYIVAPVSEWLAAGLNPNDWQDFDIQINGQPTPALRIAVDRPNNVVNLANTRDNIEAALRGLAGTGVNWPDANDNNFPYEGPVEVRLVSSLEIQQRQGTYWELEDPFSVWTIGARPVDPQDWVFEITFQGEVHDQFVGVSITSSRSAASGNPQMPLDSFYFVSGTTGTPQFNSDLAMEPDGDFVLSWTQAEQYTIGFTALQNIYVRRFEESTDTAGPQVTDVTLVDGQQILTRIQPVVLPTGQRLIDADGKKVIASVTELVIVFDEDMARIDPGKVTDPENYTLTRDGELLADVIRSVRFGLNLDTNKWEAVLVLDADPDTPGADPLPTGRYELRVRNTLRDPVGNALYATGLNRGGSDFLMDFDVFHADPVQLPIDPVSDDPGEQFTRGDDPLIHSPQSAAIDDDGEYLAAWVNATDDPSTPEDDRGIYVTLSNGLRWDVDAGQQRRRAADPQPVEIRVTDNPTAMFPSVARDGDGDFIVTWSQDDGPAGGDWNIYARRFDAAGNPFATRYDADGNPLDDGIFRVNSEIADAQRYSTVAMDEDGDIVITWQSLGQDGDGWGVYAQRYSPQGEPLGGINEIQAITFDGTDADFRLVHNGTTTGVISYRGNAFAIVDTIAGQLDQLGLEVDVAAVDMTQILIEFVGTDGSVDQPQLGLTILAPTPPEAVEVSTKVDGEGGEFLVNDTTDGNQMFPTIGMSSGGEFVISWTSDQNGDLDVFAKQFVSNDAMRLRGDDLQTRTRLWKALTGDAPPIAFGVSTDDPAAHVVGPGNGLDGVVQVIEPLTGASGSGSLLYTGRHILTAAHVVDVGPLIGVPAVIPAPAIDVAFDLPTGRTTLTSTQIFIHPDYNGNILEGNDVAIIVLPEEAPPAAERYDLYRGTDELGQVADLAGYGMFGLATTGVQGSDGNKRVVQNVFEITGEQLNGVPPADFVFPVQFALPAGTVLAYDLDSGSSANDAFGQLFGIIDVGLGVAEGSSAFGDSGGPSFIDGRIAGVVSGGLELASADIDGIPGNVSAGVIGLHSRVSAFADYIDAIAQSSGAEFLVNDTVADDQKWSSVAVDADGDFVITWTSFGQDAPTAALGGEEGVFAKRYNADGTEVIDPATGAPLGEFQVNTTGEGKQQHSQVAMDADGDFMIVWEGLQRGLTAGPSFGIYAQRYARSELLGTDPTLGPKGEISSELPVSLVMPGQHRYPAIAMDDTGDAYIVWEINGIDVFQSFLQVASDDAGPVVADVINVVVDPAGRVTMERIFPDTVLEPGVSQFLVSFGENLLAPSDTFLDSITNRDNWSLIRNGQVVRRGVKSVSFDLNRSSDAGLVPGATNKYEALITFDGDPLVTGDQPLGAGVYELRLSGRVEDLFGNRLDGDVDGRPGGDFRFGFTVFAEGGTAGSPPGDPDPGDQEDDLAHDDPTGDQIDPAVASDAEGNYVVVWAEQDPSLDDPTVLDWNIHARRFDRFGIPLGPEFIVNNYRNGDQLDPDVAMDAYGNFVIVWSGEGEFGHPDPRLIDPSGVFARVYDANGNPVGENGAHEILVNQTRVDRQHQPAVSVNDRGLFVVAWTTEPDNGANAGDAADVFARRFTMTGRALGDEFRLNSTTVHTQETPDVALADDGTLVAVWAAFDHPADNNDWGVFGRRFDAADNALSGEFRLSRYTNDKQLAPHVAMADDGHFVASWSSFLQDGNGYGVFARRFSPTAAPLDASEFQVNQTTLHYQHESAVAMADDGTFAVTWSSFGQDNELVEGFDDDFGVFARIFNADGSDLEDPANPGSALGEFQVNALVIGDQLSPDVAMDANGDMVLVWQGPDNDDAEVPGDPNNPDTDDFNGIYYRLVGLSRPALGDTFGAGGAQIPIAGNPYYAGQGDVAGTTPFVIAGTAGDDLFQFTGGPDAGAWVVKVNGQAVAVPAGTKAIQFLGEGGNDRIVAQGTAGRETGYLFAAGDAGGNNLVFIGEGFTVTAASVETINVLGGGGGDTVHLYGTADADTYTGTASYGRAVGAGYFHKVQGVSQVYFRGGGGADVARLYGTAGDEQATGSPTGASLAGDGFFHQVENVPTVSLFADEIGSPGNRGDDRVELSDDPADDDTFTARLTEVTLAGAGYSIRAVGFDTAEATSTGGADEGWFYGTPGDDHYVGRPDEATFTSVVDGIQYTNVAYNFPWNVAFAKGGANDRADLYDSAGKDGFTGTFVYGRMAGPRGDGVNYFHRTVRFERVNAYSQNGDDDVARFKDGPFNDEFHGNVDVSWLDNSKAIQRAEGFATVVATDVANPRGAVADADVGTSVAYLTGDSLTQAADGTRICTSQKGTQTYVVKVRDFDQYHFSALSSPSGPSDAELAVLAGDVARAAGQNDSGDHEDATDAAILDLFYS